MNNLTVNVDKLNTESMITYLLLLECLDEKDPNNEFAKLFKKYIIRRIVNGENISLEK